MSDSTEQRLAEYDHPYYCSESNYFARDTDTICRYDTWADWWAENENMDIDMNLVFRWDWHPAGDDYEIEHDRLTFFIMGQRKGLYRCDVISRVTADDEPAVRAYLTTVWERIQQIWAPISAGAVHA